MSKKPRSARHSIAPFVVCVNNRAYPASLERLKIYRTKPDPAAEADGLIRVLDESGEDYLYPKAMFRPIILPPALRRSLRITAAS